jgi:hypothetical protein
VAEPEGVDVATTGEGVSGAGVTLASAAGVAVEAGNVGDGPASSSPEQAAARRVKSAAMRKTGETRFMLHLTVSYHCVREAAENRFSVFLLVLHT